jgi:hypothetical protein
VSSQDLEASQTMKRALAVAAGVFALLPLGVASTGVASASTAPAPAVHPLGVGKGLPTDYIKNYSDYLTDPYGAGSGTAVKFDQDVENPSSAWVLIGDGYVVDDPTIQWPFTNSNFDQTYSGNEVVSLPNDDADNGSYGLGTVDVAAVMRPTSDGNEFVLHPLSGGDYQFISVYASNEDNLPECLTSKGAGNQAVYAQCNESGQIMELAASAWVTS